jgi:hypothetical protein
VALVALVALVAAASCSDEADPAPPVGLRDGAFEPIDGMAGDADRRPATPAEMVEVYRSVERLEAACMAGHGFTLDVLSVEDSVVPAPLYRSPEDLRASGYRYDWDRAAARFAALNGPGGPPNPTAGMTAEERAAFTVARRGPSERDTVALPDVGGSVTSHPAGGCAATAKVELYGSVENFLRFDRANEMLSHSGLARKLRQYDDYQRPFEDWQRCMGDAGYPMRPKVDYGLVWLQREQTVALSAGSGQTTFTPDLVLAVTEADADCQESSGLHEVRKELLPEAREEIAGELGFELDQYTAFQHAVVRRAERVR